MTRIDTVHTLGPPNRDLQTRIDGLFRNSASFLPICLFEEAMKERNLVLRDQCIKSFGSQSVLSLLLLLLKYLPRAEVVKPTYETAFACRALMKGYQIVHSQFIGIRRINAKDGFSEQLRYQYNTGQCYRHRTGIVNGKETEQIIEL